MVFCDFDRFQTAFLSGMAGGVMLRLPALVLLYNAAHGKSIQLAGGAACAGAGRYRRAHGACFHGAIAHANAIIFIASSALAESARGQFGHNFKTLPLPQYPSAHEHIPLSFPR